MEKRAKDMRAQYLGIREKKVNTREPPGGRAQHVAKWGNNLSQSGNMNPNDRWKLAPTSVQKVGLHALEAERQEQLSHEQTREHKWATKRLTVDKGDDIMLDMLSEFE